MFGPIFGALNAFVIFSLPSWLLAIAWAVLFVLKRRKAARTIAVLTFLFLGLTILVYLEIWWFTEGIEGCLKGSRSDFSC
jgi:hypothetical protein